MNRVTHIALGSCLAWGQLIASPEAAAVGGGLKFEADEAKVDGALVHSLKADSLDLTYHACTDIGGPNNQRLRERGYFWLSSYQDADSVVDSQINYFDANGYHIYGLYQFQAGQVGGVQPTISGSRLNYLVGAQNAQIVLYLDPEQDTTLTLQDCQVTVANDSDDSVLGFSVTVAQGEKSETDGLANGDFKIVFGNWVWQAAGADLFVPLDDSEFNFLVFNGNITGLGGALGADHSPEGSGNLFWLDEFVPVGD